MLYRAICSGITLHTANFSFSRGVRSRSSWTTREINTHKDNTEMNNGHTDTKTTAFAQMQQLPHNRFSPFFATVVSPAWTPKRGISVGLHCLHRQFTHSYPLWVHMGMFAECAEESIIATQMLNVLLWRSTAKHILANKKQVRALSCCRSALCEWTEAALL